MVFAMPETRAYHLCVVGLSLEPQLSNNDTETSYSVWELGISLGFFPSSS